MVDSHLSENNSSISGLTDGSLLRRFQSGEKDAATHLYLKYAKRLQGLARTQSSYDLARRVDAEDIVQSVFRTFFRRAKEGHYQIPDGEELWRLLLVITLNKVRSLGVYHQAAKRDVRRTSDAENIQSINNIEDWKDESALTVLKSVIDDVLKKLSPLQQEMVKLRIDGFEISEIAKRVQRSKRSVERSLQGFRESLRKMIEEDSNGE